jgi:hypothetical protein
MQHSCLLLHLRPKVIGDTRQGHPAHQPQGEPIMVNMSHVRQARSLSLGTEITMVSYNQSEPETVIVSETLTEIMRLLGSERLEETRPPEWESRRWPAEPAVSQGY